MLGAGDDLEELIELLVAGGVGFALLDAADESTELGNFLRALPGVKAEKRDENQRPHNKRRFANEHRLTPIFILLLLKITRHTDEALV